MDGRKQPEICKNFQPEKHKITKCCIFFFTRRHNEGRQGPQMEVQWPRACSRPTELPWDSGLSGRTDGCSGWSTFSPVFEAAGQVGLLSSLKLVGIYFLSCSFQISEWQKSFCGYLFSFVSVLCFALRILIVTFLRLVTLISFLSTFTFLSGTVNYLVYW